MGRHSAPKTTWIPFAPDLPDAAARALLRRVARTLARGDITSATHLADQAHVSSQLAVETATRVLIDLVGHGWQIRVNHGEVEIKRPPLRDGHDDAQRDRIRGQHQRAREEQLATTAVRTFVRFMETRRLHDGNFASVFSLMRDGRELAEALRSVRSLRETDRLPALRRVVQPYLQFVTEDAVCPSTGFRLQDIWRYFRHTWANAYVSVPGRSMMMLVRDAAVDTHPVIGIASLGSPVVQSTVRDQWIGWEPGPILEHLASHPTAASARWLFSIIERSLADTYTDDFVAEKIVTREQLRNPPREVITRLEEIARRSRALHNRGDPRERKRTNVEEDDHWLREATSDLFRSKRAATLALLLSAKAALQHAFRGRRPTVDGLRRLLHSSDGRRVVATLVRRAKGESVGIAMADIMICGALPPYNHLLGAKLIAMLLSSPEVVQAYRDRYSDTESVIASSMAGRPVRRAPRLVTLSTTSLYGVPLNQYTNVAIPASVVTGADSGGAVRFKRLGVTLGFGSFQFTRATCKALTDLRTRSPHATGVNWVFGEGVNPRMRAIREGLAVLNLPSDELLNHGSPRIVYGVALARNMREVLLGMSSEPDYYFPLPAARRATDAIASWWVHRWLSKRIMRDDVLERVAADNLVFPIRHGARVILPPDDQLSLFQDEAIY